jgi:hypothetical protein
MLNQWVALSFLHGEDSFLHAEIFAAAQHDGCFISSV